MPNYNTTKLSNIPFLQRPSISYKNHKISRPQTQNKTRSKGSDFLE